MSAYSEWEMLCIAEDIEPGDTILAEHISDEEVTMSLIVCGETENGDWLKTKDVATGKAYLFSTDSLEQKGKRTKQWRIKGKSKIAMRPMR